MAWALNGIITCESLYILKHTILAYCHSILIHVAHNFKILKSMFFIIYNTININNEANDHFLCCHFVGRWLILNFCSLILSVEVFMVVKWEIEEGFRLSVLPH
jgi:hypothetical protein